MGSIYLATIFGNAEKNKPAPETEEPINATPAIILADPSDLTIQIFQETKDERYTSATGYNVWGKLLATFKVSREVLMRSSDHFQKMLDPAGNFAECKQKIVDLENANPIAVELWLRYFHGKLDDESLKIPIGELRALIECHRRYFFPLEKLNKWFEQWMEHKGGKKMKKFSLDELRKLMYPCQEFNHAQGFAYATKKLVYETPGHVHEDTPLAFGHLHLEPRIIGAINAARGSVKMKLHEALYINRVFLNASCDCRKEGLFAYETALDKTGVWPLEEVLHGRNSISLQRVLSGMRKFEYEPPNDYCELCSEDFGASTVTRAINIAQSNFDGLCLDCIDNPHSRDWDIEYTKHHSFKLIKAKHIEWDMGCRVKHEEPSWYFSWIARKQRADAHEREGESREGESRECESRECESRERESRERQSRKRKASEMEADD